MNVVIIEDESLASEKFSNLLNEIDESINVTASLKSIESAVEWFSDNDHPDLVISDIRLLDGLSFDLFRQIDLKKPVIFTTAYDQYAIKAFEVNSIDYLLKPIQKEKLTTALEKYVDRSLLEETEELQSNVFDELKQMIETSGKNYKTRFMIKSGNKILAVPVEKVAYFFSQNKLTYVVTHDDKKFALDQPLELLIPQLDPQKFFRANRKYIISFESIDEIHPYFKGRIKINLTPSSEDDIVVSSERTPEFKKWLDA